MEEVNIPISFVPAKMITKDKEGLLIPFTADLNPTEESSRYSTIVDAVHPGSPLHRTTTDVLLDSEYILFNSRSREGPYGNNRSIGGDVPAVRESP
jgi:hypothetical protein